MHKLTVATLNLHQGASRWLKRRHVLVAELLALQPDILALQEIYLPLVQGLWLKNQVNARLSGSSRHPYRIIQARRRHLVRGYFEGVGILTRLPIVSHDVLNLGYGGRVALRANIELPSGADLDFVSLHLHHAAAERQARLEQVMAVMGWLNDRNPIAYQVIAGDFSEVPQGLAIRHIKQVYRSAFAEVVGREPLATYPTALVATDGWAGCLDYIFVSPALAGLVRAGSPTAVNDKRRPGQQVGNAGIFAHTPSPDDDTLFPSDHVGLWATLQFAER